MKPLNRSRFQTLLEIILLTVTRFARFSGPFGSTVTGARLAE